MKIKTSTVRSAGGVVLREEGSSVQALLIATHGNRRWSLPKGRIEAGEKVEQAALREVAEETGITALILAPLDTVEYWFFVRRNLRLHKIVAYFLMEYSSGSPVPQLSEVDDARWWTLEDALNRVAYKNDQRLLKAAQEHWQAHRARASDRPDRRT